MSNNVISEHNQQITDANGKEYTVTVQVIYDDFASVEDAEVYCFGTDDSSLRMSRIRDKRPSEVKVYSDYDSYWYIDFAKLVKDSKKHLLPLPQLTRGQQAANFAKESLKMFKDYLNEYWRFIGVRAVLLNPDGTESEICDSVWGISDKDTGLIQECKEEMVANVLHTINNNMTVVAIERYTETRNA